MNIYNAIMRAADHIERHPKEFNFESIEVPNALHCGTPGCALGWIAFFGQVEARNAWGSRLEGAAESLGANDAWGFYRRMDDLCRWNGLDLDEHWIKNAAVCASTLRAYAEKYHGHEKPQRRTDAELVADLMARVTGSRIPDEAPANAVSA